jgi:phosphatidate phosphatase LPIN
LNLTTAPQVNVFVNGHPIPFNMKIGEAGEAFFVFETDEDVPDDLITSPILHPTRPDEVAQNDAGVPSERLDATQGPDNEQNAESEQELRTHLNGEDEVPRKDSDIQEPEFLDLNALPSPPRDDDDPLKNVNITPKQTFSMPSMVRRPSHISITQPTQALPSPPPTPGNLRGTHIPEMMAQDERVDRAITAVHQDLHVPEVDYRRSELHSTPFNNYTHLGHQTSR